jgi:hypothetical protein
MPDNRSANYYRVIGSDAGAYRSGRAWVGIRNFRRNPELIPVPCRRWQGPPNAAIQEALKNPRKEKI